MFSITTLISILTVIQSNLVSGHLILNEPQVWGVNDGVSLEQPLDQSTQNWICAGKQPDTNSVVNLVAGNTYSFQTICGEQDVNAPGCLIGDWHTGDDNSDYSGCALAVSYSDYKNPSNHQYLSYTHDCPKRGVDTTFVVSPNVQNCERCVCSWAWAPSRDYSSPPQFYHNCFYCSISGGNNATMKQFDFINVPNAAYVDKTYNDIVNPDELYSSVAPTNTVPVSSSTTVPSSTTISSSTTVPSSTPTCKRRTVTVDVTITPSPTCGCTQASSAYSDNYLNN